MHSLVELRAFLSSYGIQSTSIGGWRVLVGDDFWGMVSDEYYCNGVLVNRKEILAKARECIAKQKTEKAPKKEPKKKTPKKPKEEKKNVKHKVDKAGERGRAGGGSSKAGRKKPDSKKSSRVRNAKVR